MSEGRQLTLLLLGGLVLAAIGIAAATAFPEPCEEFEGAGSLQLQFADARDALPLETEDAGALEAVGDELDIGIWRGAVRLPTDAQLLPSDFGFFVTTPTDLVALRPGTGVASAPRDLSGVGTVSVGGTAVGLVDEDGTVAVIASDYERLRCGEVPAGADVVAVDRGFAVVVTDSSPDATVSLVTLSGEDVWSLGAVEGFITADVLTDHVAVVTGAETTLHDLRSGTLLDTLPRSGEDTLLAIGDGVLVDTTVGGGELVVTRIDEEEGTLAAETVAPVDGSVRAVATTPAGLVTASATTLGTDRGATVELPPGVEVVRLLSSEDGNVGLVAEVDGVRAVLVWGRDLP